MIKVAVVAVSSPAIHMLRQFEKEYGSCLVEMRIFNVADDSLDIETIEDDMKESLRNSDIAVIDIMGTSERLHELISQLLEKSNGQRIIIGNACRDKMRLGKFFAASFMNKNGKSKNSAKKTAAMKQMRRLAFFFGTLSNSGLFKDMKNIFRLSDYWQQAGKDDIYSFMYLLLREYFNLTQLPKPLPTTRKKGIIIKNPKTGEIFNRLYKYKNRIMTDSKKENVALFYYGHNYPNDFTPVAAAIFTGLGSKFNIYPFAFTMAESKDLEKVKKQLISCGRIVAIVNIMPFRLGAGPMGGDSKVAIDMLKEINAPYLKPFCLTKTSYTKWLEESGVNPGEFLINILLPELDGGTNIYPIAIASNYKNPEMLIMRDRIEDLIRRIESLSTLQKKENYKKKVAIISYNYPPGEDNLFGAAFLDSFKSISAILSKLHDEGYQVDKYKPEEIEKIFLEDGICNNAVWHDEQESENSYEMRGEKYDIKGIVNKNVFIGVQPTKNDGRVDVNSYHDKQIRPSREYEAYYNWISEKFRADAVIHVGTHGTLEFLPGKEVGVSRDCWPDKLIGDIPHFYFYYVGNPSEAMTAKRRSNAVLIGYAPPPYIRSNLYGKYADLQELIAEYRESLQIAPQRSMDLLKDIEKLTKEEELSILSESVEAEASHTTVQEKLDLFEEELYKYETSLIPDGFHVLGRGYEEEDAQKYAEQVLEYSKDKLEKNKLMNNCIQNFELENMIRALNGEYIEVSSAGDILKNPDILPSGSNLVQFDPTMIPTAAAVRRGAIIAEKTLEKYFKEKGCYPKATAVILWGLETSKTYGETIGQILYYLGAGIAEKERSYDSRFEIIDIEKLDRPRIDVTIHICGFFRDMFPNLLRDINGILRKLSRLEESDEQSYFAANSRKRFNDLLKKGYSRGDAEKLSYARIFGPGEGEYGSGIERLVREKSWNREEELGTAFTDGLSYVYVDDIIARPAVELLKKNYQEVDLISQVRNNVEYELIDLDHYYEFYGGLSKSIENIKGYKAEMYVADTVRNEIEVDEIRTAIEKGVITRLLNPTWIDGMLRHQYHGGQQISKRFENVVGMAATTGKVSKTVFAKLQGKYVKDEKMRKRMQVNNKWAYIELLNRLIEARERGYWEATDDDMESLRKAYLETEGELES